MARTGNQLRLADWPTGHRRLAVLDGMGGHSHGREAAEKVIEGLLGLPAATDLAQLSEALTPLHQRLYQEFHTAGLETGCTLVLLEIPVKVPPCCFTSATRALYAIDEHRVQCLTVDHVPATHLAMLGLLNGTPVVPTGPHSNQLPNQSGVHSRRYPRRAASLRGDYRRRAV